MSSVAGCPVLRRRRMLRAGRDVAPRRSALSACCVVLLVAFRSERSDRKLRRRLRRPDVIRYEGGRLTVRVTDMPLDRLLAEIAAVTHATVRGTVEPRPVAIDFKDASLADGLDAHPRRRELHVDVRERRDAFARSSCSARACRRARSPRRRRPRRRAAAARRRGGSGGDPAANRDGRRGARDRARHRTRRSGVSCTRSYRSVTPPSAPRRARWRSRPSAGIRRSKRRISRR